MARPVHEYAQVGRRVRRRLTRPQHVGQGVVADQRTALGRQDSQQGADLAAAEGRRRNLPPRAQDDETPE